MSWNLGIRIQGPPPIVKRHRIQSALWKTCIGTSRSHLATSIGAYIVSVDMVGLHYHAFTGYSTGILCFFTEQIATEAFSTGFVLLRYSL